MSKSRGIEVLLAPMCGQNIKSVVLYFEDPPTQYIVQSIWQSRESHEKTHKLRMYFTRGLRFDGYAHNSTTVPSAQYE